MRFSKKILMFTMGATLVYAVVYIVLCYMIGQLPDYSFNAGLFAALSAENLCNAWIKVKEAQGGSDNTEAKEPDPPDDTEVFTPIDKINDTEEIGG